MHYLSEAHRNELEVKSAISPRTVADRGYYTARSGAELPSAFAAYQRRPGLVIPIRDTTGMIATWQLKADNPRLNKDGESIKYDTAVGGRQCLDVPASCRPYLANPAMPLWITEGAKKVDSGLSHGITSIIGVQGVYGWRGMNGDGGKVALPDWEDIALNGREVVLAFDSDVMTKASVRDALDRLGAFLRKRGATVLYLLLPEYSNERRAV